VPPTKRLHQHIEQVVVPLVKAELEQTITVQVVVVVGTVVVEVNMTPVVVEVPVTLVELQQQR
jgi:hypothetical protein